MRRLFTIFGVVVLMFVMLIPEAGNSTIIRPYGKVGYLLSTPSAEDLGFVLVDGGSMDDALESSNTTYGFGVQMLHTLENTWIKKTNTRVGIDIGAQKLWHYEFQASDESTEWIGDEYDFYFMGLIEFAIENSPLFFQGGLGLHIVFWSEESEFEGTYSYESDSDSGSGTNFSFMLAAGVDLPVNEKLKVPIILQLDNIFRYDLMPTLSVLAGVSIGF